MKTIGHDTLTISQPREYSLERTNGANSMNEWRRTTFAIATLKFKMRRSYPLLSPKYLASLERTQTLLFFTDLSRQRMFKKDLQRN